MIFERADRAEMRDAADALGRPLELWLDAFVDRLLELTREGGDDDA